MTLLRGSLEKAIKIRSDFMERANDKAFSSSGLDTTNREFEGKEERKSGERVCARYAAAGSDKSGVGASAGLFNMEDKSGSNIKVAHVGVGAKCDTDGIGVTNDVTLIKSEFIPEGHGVGVSAGVDFSSKAVATKEEVALQGAGFGFSIGGKKGFSISTPFFGFSFK